MRYLLKTIAIASIANLGVAGLAQAEPSERAKALAQSSIIVDGHIDAPGTIVNTGADIATGKKAIQFDFARARTGGLDAPFMSIYVAADYEARGAKARADILIGLMEGISHANPDKFVIATSPDEVREAHEKGLVALPLGMENGSPIEGDLNNLKHFYDRGIRYITLAHSKSNHISDSSYDTNERWEGLSPFGAQMVSAMNDIGIMIDISHVTDAAAEEVLEITRVPVIASHSSLRHFTPGWHRNMPDDLVRKVGENGGVVMINYGSAFLTADANGYNGKRDEARAAAAKKRGRALTPKEAGAFNVKWRKENPYPFATVDDVLDHIDRAVELAGIDHVGLGSDYDGVGNTLPVGLKDASSFPTLIDGLIGRGYDDEGIKKILGENALRVWQEVEDGRRKRKWF